MNYLMCTEFINFIKENGRDILKNPASFESSLQAYCSTKNISKSDMADAFILTEALREGIVQELLEVKVVGDTLIRKLSKQLQAACGFTEYASDGAIDTWCYALGLKEVPMEKVEEARVDESATISPPFKEDNKENPTNSDVINVGGYYIAKESRFYGLNDFIFYWKAWLYFGVLAVYFIIASFYLIYQAGSRYQSNWISLSIVTGGILFLLYENHILQSAENKSFNLIKLIRFYLYYMLLQVFLSVLLILWIEFGSTYGLSELRIPAYIATAMLGSVTYFVFQYFSKSKNIKATYGQYLIIDEYLLSAEKVTKEESIRLNNLKNIDSETVELLTKEKKREATSDMIFGILWCLVGLFVTMGTYGAVEKLDFFNYVLSYGGISVGVIFIIRYFQKKSEEKSNTVTFPKEELDTNSGSGVGKMIVGVVVALIGIIITKIGYESASRAGGKYTVFYGLIVFGVIQFIRGFVEMVQSTTKESNSEKTNTQSSTNTNYSQKPESTNTYSSDNTNYAKQSESVKQENTDADYSKQTSNQSTKKEEQPKKEKTIEDRLEELKRLQDKGIITEAEFQTRKIEILKEL